MAKQIDESLGNLVLGIVSLLGHAFTEAVLDHYHRGYPKAASKAAVYTTLYRLNRSGLIRKKINQGQICYKLTAAGKSRLLVRRAFQRRNPAKDGYSSVVIFDIPEEKRKARPFLRSLLLKNGFVNLQKSVLIAPYELPKDFFELLTELGIRQYVSILKSKVINL